MKTWRPDSILHLSINAGGSAFFLSPKQPSKYDKRDKCNVWRDSELHGMRMEYPQAVFEFSPSGKLLQVVINDVEINHKWSGQWKPETDEGMTFTAEAAIEFAGWLQTAAAIAARLNSKGGDCDDDDNA